MKPLELKNISDEGLVNLLRDDNECALNEIFNRYWERLFWMAEKVLLDNDASKDIVQDIMVNIWERRHVVIISNLNAYLIQAVKYQIATYLRNGKLTDYHIQKVESTIFVNNTEDTINFNELKRTILNSLDQLPDRCSEIFYLSRFQGLNNKEIAQKLSISIRTVETQISRALKFLRVDLRTSLLSIVLMTLLH